MIKKKIRRKGAGKKDEWNEMYNGKYQCRMDQAEGKNLWVGR